MWSQVPSTLSRYGVTLRGNVTSVYPPLHFVAIVAAFRGFGDATGNYFRYDYRTLWLEGCDVVR